MQEALRLIPTTTQTDVLCIPVIQLSERQEDLKFKVIVDCRKAGLSCTSPCLKEKERKGKKKEERNIYIKDKVRQHYSGSLIHLDLEQFARATFSLESLENQIKPIYRKKLFSKPLTFLTLAPLSLAM